MKNEMTNVKALAFVIENCELPTEVAEKVAKIKDSFERKSENRKPTATQVENVGIKETIVQTLATIGSGSVTEIQCAEPTLATLSNQKVSRLVAQLVESGKVSKVYDKKKAIFSLVQSANGKGRKPPCPLKGGKNEIQV